MAYPPSEVSQQNPLLVNRLYISPTPSEPVPCPRLVKRLNEGLHGQLTLIFASPQPLMCLNRKLR